MDTKDKNSGAAHPYWDILDAPRPVSRAHPPMSMLNRAAQFAPYAALTGFDDAIDETARLTDLKIELGQEERETLDRRLRALMPRLPARVALTYFVADRLKAGGRYVSETVELRRILSSEGVLLLAGGRKIQLEDVLDIE